MTIFSIYVKITRAKNLEDYLPFMRIIKKYVKKFLLIFYKLNAKIVKLKPNCIIFESSLFRNYTGNPRYIYEEFVKQGLDEKFEVFWIFKNPDEIDVSKIPGKFTVLKYKTMPFFKMYSAAAFIVSDSRLPKYLRKNRKCQYIQTWHGTPLKKLALDMQVLNMSGSSNIERYHMNFRKSISEWDYLLSQNSYSTKIFRSCFDFDKTILEVGYPRNDKLLNTTASQIYELKRNMGLPLNKKVILYAPTWRDNAFYKKGEYKFVSKVDFDALQDALSDEYVMIVKYHYLIKDSVDWSKYEGFVYQFGEECDIADLYLVSDMLITDYSSVMFDYSVLNRPLLFFTYDYDEYMTDLRGFYFDFKEEAPGPLVYDNDELIESIKNYNAEEWSEKYEAFHDKYNHCDEGTASKAIVDLIVENSYLDNIEE